MRLLPLLAAAVWVLHELQIDVIWISYLLGKPQRARVHRARGLLPKIELDGLAVHDRCAEHVRQLLLALAQLQNSRTLIVLPLVLSGGFAVILRPRLLILLLDIVLVSCSLVAVLLGRGQRLVVLAAYVVEDLCELLVLRCRSPHDPASITKVRLLTLLAHLIPPIATNKRNS